jgi:malate dehydrogenase (oxaloacetate-decarboxylating)(NADP+)
MNVRDKNKTGYQRLLDPALNKSTAFSEEERDKYHLRGLLPPKIFTLEQQLSRVLANLRRKESDIEKYIFLQGLQDRNDTLFFRTVIDNIEEMMPLIYTPTVGQACREFASIFRRSRGLYVTANDTGRVEEILRNWPEKDVRVIVVTDGERILGLGDLGANGMGISVGKLSLYVACAGIHPEQCLPITLDVGTQNHTLRDDPLYLGLNQDRLRGEAYDALVEELVEATQKVFPEVLLQFEDFVTPNAYHLLDIYRDRVLCFNDDIQGTAAVALAGLYAATRVSGVDFADQRIMFLGAGSAATGIADLIVPALMEVGLSQDEARERLWFCNSRGLVVKSSDRLQPHNLPYAHDRPQMSFLEAIEEIKPTGLIGATGRPGMFDQEALGLMAKINKHPLVFALSNPTSNAECTAEQAYQWTEGRVIFASGSPFPPVEYNGEFYKTGQGNNAYIFPGIGLGALACKATRISDGMFLASSRALAESVEQSDLDRGSIYPPLPDIRRVSLEIAIAVAQEAVKEGLAQEEHEDWADYIAHTMYDPGYG